MNLIFPRLTNGKAGYQTSIPNPKTSIFWGGVISFFSEFDSGDVLVMLKMFFYIFYKFKSVQPSAGPRIECPLEEVILWKQAASYSVSIAI